MLTGTSLFANFNLALVLILAVSSAAAVVLVASVVIVARRWSRANKIRRQDLADEERGKVQEEYKVCNVLSD